MEKRSVRLSEITIQNLKNVKYGHLDFTKQSKNYQASILGLYGQNGSGKTALIDVLQLLKYGLSGKKIPDGMKDFIRADEESAAFEFCFDITGATETFRVYYQFSLKKGPGTEENPVQVVFFDEVLKYSYDGPEGNIRKTPLIDTRTDRVFVPASKYKCLIGDYGIDMLVAKKMALRTSKSFIFSAELISTLKKQRSTKSKDLEFLRYVDLIMCMKFYGDCELFVINTANTGMISMDFQPLAFIYEGAESSTAGYMALNLNKPTVIPEKAVNLISRTIQDMNLVLEQVVPGLNISLRKLGGQLMENGQNGEQVELVSQRGDIEIPLRCESEGIKKIVSILQLLIVVYNNSSITVAIDELDSGIFEYLLGELVRIISENGKGQLIFTSHNLRPLETLDRGFIAFTTTNPENRYIRMAYVKSSNNLRDYYFRDIVLGEQSEEVYETTNNAEISFAFREAGEFSAT